MRVLIYEFITGGGCFEWNEIPQGSLLREGKAMIRALLEDFSRMRDCTPFYLRDVRVSTEEFAGEVYQRVACFAEEQSALVRAANEMDAVLIVAPELEHALLKRVRLVENARGTLLSPASDFVAIASDKLAARRRLAESGVPVPHDYRPDTPHARYMVKPRFGAGSLGVRCVAGDDPVAANPPPDMCVEEFREGVPASVAVLCGPGVCTPLPACAQVLSQDGCFSYLGGRCPLSVNENRRAAELAVAAVGALPRARGYVGVDMILGPAGDCVVEINPRLTTSYTGLRALCNDNLAEAMVGLAEGGAYTLSFRDNAVTFTV